MEIIDELTRWSENVEATNLEQGEEIVLKLRKRLSERTAELVIANAGLSVICNVAIRLMR